MQKFMNPIDMIEKFGPKRTLWDKIASWSIVLFLIGVVLLAIYGAYDLLAG